MAAAPQQMCHSTVSRIILRFHIFFFFFDHAKTLVHNNHFPLLLDFSALHPFDPFFGMLGSVAGN